MARNHETFRSFSNFTPPSYSSSFNDYSDFLCYKNPQQDTLKEYRKMMERQKAPSLKEEQEALKRIPEMTPESYEKLGDSYSINPRRCHHI